jgi:predicted transcriptional regulator of viral defense system
MGKRKYLTRIEKFIDDSPVVTFDSIQRLSSKGYAKLLINKLLKTKRLIRLAKGYYTNRNDISLAVYAFAPAYLGLQSALSAHDLWEQETIPIILTTQKVRNGIRQIDGANILLRTIDEKLYFGYKTLQEGDTYLPYSDIEKTYLDLLYYKQNINSETLKKIKKRLDSKKLKKYLKDYPKAFQKSL